MDKIIEFLNNQTNNKYSDLLFFGANFNKKSSTMQMQFGCNQNYEKYKENVEEIKVLCKNYFQNLVKNVDVTIKTNSLTMQSLRKSIIEAIKNQDLLGVDFNDIKIEFENDITKILVPYQSGSINFEQIENKKINIQNEIFEKLNYNIQIQFIESKIETGSILNSRKDRIVEDSTILEDMKKSEIVKLHKVESIFGDFNEKSAYIAGRYGDETEITIVGNVKSCYLRETKPKENAENKSTRRYMSFELEYENSVTKFIWFVSKEMQVSEFETGTTLAVFGKKEIYNNNVSIRVKSIAKCTFTPPEKVWRKCPTEYRFVKPELYEHSEQTNFLDTYKKTNNEYLLNNTFVVYDLETTGKFPEVDKIIDIGAYKLVNGVIVEKFCTFVNPECEIPAKATKINHITQEMVANSPTIDMVLPDFFKFCYNSIIVGYNNIGFDDLFIKKEGEKQLLNFDNKKDDVYKIAYDNLHGLHNYKLGTVCNYENVPLIDAHRAANDALATAKLFVKLVEKYC